MNPRKMDGIQGKRGGQVENPRLARAKPEGLSCSISPSRPKPPRVHYRVYNISASSCTALYSPTLIPTAMLTTALQPLFLPIRIT